MSKTQRHKPKWTQKKTYKTWKRAAFVTMEEARKRDRWARGFDKHWPSHFGGKDDWFLEGHMKHRDRLKPELPKKGQENDT